MLGVHARQPLQGGKPGARQDGVRWGRHIPRRSAHRMLLVICMQIRSDLTAVERSPPCTPPLISAAAWHDNQADHWQSGRNAVAPEMTRTEHPKLLGLPRAPPPLIDMPLRLPPARLARRPAGFGV